MSFSVGQFTLNLVNILLLVVIESAAAEEGHGIEQARRPVSETSSHFGGLVFCTSNSMPGIAQIYHGYVLTCFGCQQRGSVVNFVDVCVML